jgi:hypothetical protein
MFTGFALANALCRGSLRYPRNFAERDQVFSHQSNLATSVSSLMPRNPKP